MTEKLGLPKSTADRIAHLRASHDAHGNVNAECAKADGGNLFPVDLVVAAVLKRSLALMEGFCLLVEHRNMLCAAALIRLQIDSAMRLNAFNLVSDPAPLLTALLKGEPLGHITSTTGQRLSDNYLREELSKLYPWVNSVYEATSSFVHLSQPHMMAPVASVQPESRGMRMEIGSDSGRVWTEEEMNEAVDAFTAATKAVLELSYNWARRKKEVGEEREKRKGSDEGSSRQGT